MYKEHFGFTELPFHVTPDPRFFYSNRLYQEAFTGVRWGIKLRRGLIVMTGEAGTGKTTLLRMVTEKFESNTHAALISRHHQDFAELLRRMLIDFGLTEYSRRPTYDDAGAQKLSDGAIPERSYCRRVVRRGSRYGRSDP